MAEDQQTDEAIAAAVGVTKTTLENWKQRPEFRDRVQGHIQAFAEAIRDKGIAERVNRVEALNDRWRRMQQVIDERAEAMEGEVAGGGTGLLVRQEKQIGAGERAIHVVEYALDTGILSELRQHEKQAAQELGQWTEKQEHSGRDGAAIQYQVEVRPFDYRAASQHLAPPDADRAGIPDDPWIGTRQGY